jgi:hypothetical protein
VSATIKWRFTRWGVGLAAALVFASVLTVPAEGRTVRPAKAKHCTKRTSGKLVKRRLCRALVRRAVPVTAVTPAVPGVPPLASPAAPSDQVAPNARCELVVLGPCSIYTEKFWDLQAKYEPLEIAFASYPVSPECGEVCAAVVVYLYPDGTLGSSVWIPDPCAPGGWRILDPFDPPPC